MSRQHKRFPISLEIMLDFVSGRREARISDLSVGGCFVDTILKATENESVKFEIRIPTGEFLKMTGKIVYTADRFGFGIRFTNVTEEQKFLIEQTILTYGGEPYDTPG